MPTSDQPCYYQIHLNGQLSRQWIDYFADYQIQSGMGPDSSPNLVLSGIFKDQAALMGTLQTLYNLGCVLVSVERRDVV